MLKVVELICIGGREGVAKAADKHVMKPGADPGSVHAAEVSAVVAGVAAVRRALQIHPIGLIRPGFGRPAST